MKSSRFTSLVAFVLAALVFPLQILAIAGLWLYEQARVHGAPFAPLALGVNSYTNLIADAYQAMDVVSRELVGFIPAVQRNSSAERCALNANAVRSGVVPINSAAGDVTPAMSIPAAAYQTIGNKSLQITKARYAPFSWTGEDQVALNSGAGYLTIKQDQIAQAMRALVNEAELDLATAATVGASRAYGTAGTTPFATTLAATAQIRKILSDNGAPVESGDLHLVMDTAAGANVRTLTQLTKVNEAADASLLRQGVLLNIHGFNLRESAQVLTPTAGTMASATSTSAAFTVGQTAIPLATAGTGVVAAGDIITFANDTNQYVVSAVSFAGANPASGDTITLAAPGLRKAQGIATRAITVIAAAARNVGFTRNAIQFATRLPALPAEGDLATMREIITDDRSGLSFELAAYPGYRMTTYHLLIAWGQLVVKPEHVATLLG